MPLLLPPSKTGEGNRGEILSFLTAEPGKKEEREALLPGPVLWVGRKPREPKMQMERGKEERRDEKEGGKEEEKGGGKRILYSSYFWPAKQQHFRPFGVLFSPSFRSLFVLLFFPSATHIMQRSSKRNLAQFRPFIWSIMGRRNAAHLSTYTCTVSRGFSCWLGPFVRGLSCCLVFFVRTGLTVLLQRPRGGSSWSDDDDVGI